MAWKPTSEDVVPCPGCGGRGKFEWPTNPKVPKGWSNTAPCRLCRGTGKVPATWLKRTAR